MAVFVTATGTGYAPRKYAAGKKGVSREVVVVAVVLVLVLMRCWRWCRCGSPWAYPTPP